QNPPEQRISEKPAYLLLQSHSLFLLAAREQPLQPQDRFHADAVLVALQRLAFKRLQVVAQTAELFHLSPLSQAVSDDGASSVEKPADDSAPLQIATQLKL